MAREDVVIRFGADASGLNRAMKSIEGQVDGLRRGFALLGVGISVGGMASIAKSALDSADAIGKAADKIGLTTDALQELRHAASLSGLSQSALDTSMQRFSRRVGEAAQGQGELKDTLAQYNVAVRDAAGNLRPLEEIFSDYANAMQGAESSQEKLRMAVKAFDTEGAGMVNMLKNGTDGLDQMRQAARDAGLVIEEESIRAAEALNDQWGTAVASAQTRFQRFVLSVMAGWKKIIESTESGAFAFTEGLSKFDDLTAVARKIAAVKAEIADVESRSGRNARNSGDQLAQLRERLALLEREKQIVVARVAATRSRSDEQNQSGGSASAISGLNPEFSANLRAMIAAASAEGIQIGITSGLRTTERQAELWQQALAKYGSAAAARKWVAPPGKSLHEKGMAADISGSASAKAWAARNAARFGLTFPLGNEPWHVELAGARGGSATKKTTAATKALTEAERERQRVQEEGLRIWEQTRTTAESHVLTMDRLTALYQVGAIDLDTYNRAAQESAKGLQKVETAAKQSNDAAQQLGMTFSSAFEDAIVNGMALRDVLKGILQDIARIVVRKSISEPVGGAISGIFSKGVSEAGGSAFSTWFSSLFKAEGGPVRGGSPYIVGEQGPELFVPSTSGSIVPNNAMPIGMNVTVNNHASGYEARVSQSGDSLTIDVVRAVLAGDLSQGGQAWTRALDGRVGRGY